VLQCVAVCCSVLKALSSLQKSRIFPKDRVGCPWKKPKSPIFSQESLIFLQKSPIFPHKSPLTWWRHKKRRQRVEREDKSRGKTFSKVSRIYTALLQKCRALLQKYRALLALAQKCRALLGLKNKRVRHFTHTATHCNTLPRTATYRNTPQHTATHYNTLQHTALL